MIFKLPPADFDVLLKNVSKNPTDVGASAIGPVLMYFDEVTLVRLYLIVDGITYGTVLLKGEGFDEDNFKMEILAGHNALELVERPDERQPLTLKVVAE